MPKSNDWQERLTLRKLGDVATDLVGNPTPATTEITVWADKQEIFSSEFWNADKVGVKLEAAFLIRKNNWDNQEEATYKGIDYIIKRPREFNKDYILLFLERVKGRSNAS